MAEPTIQIGGGNWAGKSDNLLGYYKEGERFYKQDFTFSRSTTGTYTDSDGYIQEMPYNEVTYSEQFDNGAWTKSGTTIIANDTTSPDGTINADKIYPTSSGNYRHIRTSLLNPTSGLYTFSIYAKKAELDHLVLLDYDGSGVGVDFDLTNGVATDNASTAFDSVEMIDVGNGWYRCIATATNMYFYWIVSDNGGLSVTSSGTSGLYIWGGQAVKGTSAKTYFPTTTRLNMPRVDYLNNSNGSLILEPQRTNLVTHSSDFSEWSTIGSPTLTSNYGQSPDGLNNSTRVQFSSGDRIYTSASLSGDISYSVYLKGNGTVRMRDNSGAYSNDVTLTNEWVRYDYTFNASISNVQLQQSSGTSDFEIYGAQVESGSYPTSLIPTTGTAVTRLADACSLTNASDIIGQTEGVIFVDISNMQDLDFPDITIDNNNNNDRIVLTRNTSGKWGIFAASSIAGSAFASAYSNVIGNDGKFAIAYSSSNYALWRNGVEIATLTYDLPSALSTLRLNGRSTNDFYSIKKVQNIKLYNTRLSNSELATLTTL